MRDLEQFISDHKLDASCAHELRHADREISRQALATCDMSKARNPSAFALVWWAHHGAEVRGPSGKSAKPTAAMIVKDRDELRIPLMLEAIPTPKEFKDAIESLSPEQRAFCEAYRSMQLEGSIFGVLVIELKPALEALLGLADGSLTKEIALTRSLLELFMT